MSTNDQLSQWAQFTKPMREAGITSYAIVAVGTDGHVYWGSSFPDHKQDMIAKLRQIESDIKDSIKRDKERTALAS